MQVGFLGLGGMGRHMASNLVKAGHQVLVWNRTRPVVDELVREGAKAATPQEAFSAEAVLTMLADDPSTREVVLLSGVLDTARHDIVSVNMATISVSLAKELTAEHTRRGLSYVAAPVFGRPEAAAARQLNIVAAGQARAIERVQPLFDALGQKTWRVGEDPYRANVVKIGGNFMIASAIETMAEAVAFARGHGLAASDLLDVVTNTILAAPIYKGYGAMIAAQRYEPAAFRLTLGLKDVRLALSEAETVHAPMPFASVLRDNFLDAIAHGGADLDWSAVAEVAFRRAGLSDDLKKNRLD